MLMGQLTYVHFYQTIQFKKCKIPILREYKIADTQVGKYRCVFWCYTWFSSYDCTIKIYQTFITLLRKSYSLWIEIQPVFGPSICFHLVQKSILKNLPYKFQSIEYTSMQNGSCFSTTQHCTALCCAVLCNIRTDELQGGFLKFILSES